MKILQISYSNYLGGASRAVWRLHKCMSKNNINTDLMVINADKTISKKIFSPYNKLQYKIFFLKKILSSLFSKIFLPNRLSIQSCSLFQTNFYKFINSSSYDIINLHWICAETMSIEDIGKVKKPIVWTLHDMWPFTKTEHFTFNNDWKTIIDKKKNNISSFIQKIVLRRKLLNWKKKNFYIVGVSDWISNCAKKSLLFRNNKIVTIGNTLDFNFWKPIDKVSCKKYFNIPFNVKVFGHGSLGKSNQLLKGRDLLEKALEISNFKKTKAVILNFGDTNLNLNSEIKVINLGKLMSDKDILFFYNSLDFFINSSRLESFGQTALEANSCGVPVLCFNTSGLKDIIKNKKNGLCIENFNINKFAKGLNFFLNINKSDYKKMSNFSRKHVLKKFSYNAISKKYMNLYSEIKNNN
jgi:glycosyltransferase involved in cell wall biosynthesis